MHWSSPSSCVHASHGLWQQNCKRRSRQSKLDVFKEFLASATLTTSLDEEICRTIGQHIGHSEDLNHSKDEETEMVRACDWINRALQDHPPGNSAGEKKTRQTQKEMDRQHWRIDWKDLRCDPVACSQPPKMEPACAAFICAATLRPRRVTGPVTVTAEHKGPFTDEYCSHDNELYLARLGPSRSPGYVDWQVLYCYRIRTHKGQIRRPGSLGVAGLLKGLAGLTKAWLGFSKAWLGFSKAWLGFSKAWLGFSKAWLGFSKAWLGFSKAWLGFSKAWLGWASQRLGLAGLLKGLAGLLKGLAGLLKGLAGLLKGLAGLLKGLAVPRLWPSSLMNTNKHNHSDVMFTYQVAIQRTREPRTESQDLIPPVSWTTGTCQSATIDRNESYRLQDQNSLPLRSVLCGEVGGMETER